MKILCANELVRLLPASSQDVAEALQLLQSLIARFESVASLQYRFEEGLIQCVNVEIAGQRIYTIFFCHDSITKSIQFAAARMDRGSEDFFPLLVESGEKIAREKGARWIHFSTKRAGIVEKFQRFGYEPDTINMVKEVA